MGRIVCKFGGTSLADHHQFRKVQAIVASNPKRRVVVPSAPGKRHKNEAKITDLLYLCHETAAMHTDFAGPFNELRDRYLEIERELGLAAGLAKELESFRGALGRGISRDEAASRGEYFSGRLLAMLLGAEFVDPADHIVIRSDGTVDPASYPRLGAAMADLGKIYVMPGFYGRDAAGQIKTFSRGGSDISGVVAARAIEAELYENWTDVSGLLMADPRIVENPRHMEEVTYREIRELSYMGAAVFHDEAILPVREVGMPINIRNTNRPDDPGTLIVAKLSPEIEKNTEIAGIAGKKNFCMIGLDKSLMNKEVGFGYRLLGVLEQHKIAFEHCPSGIDSMSVILEAGQLGDKTEVVLDEIRRVLQPDDLTLERDLALIAVVGEGMIHTIGIAAKVFTALRDAKVNVRVINQGASELSIIVGVAAADYETAVRAIYRAFVPA
jgi:aspartate kinase